MIQHPLSAPGRLLNGDANSSHADGKPGGATDNMTAAQQRPNRLPLPDIGPKWPPWEPLTGSFIKVSALGCARKHRCWELAKI
jgi:hypothetical protein